MSVLPDQLPPVSRPILDPARPTDAEAIGRILSDWIDEVPWIPRVHSREEEQGFAREMVARGWVTVARRCGRVVGFLAHEGAEVMALYVEAGARGQGIGSALIEQAKRAAPRLALWALQRNEAAQAFYLGHGFYEVGRTDGAGNDEKLPDIRYQWESGE